MHRRRSAVGKSPGDIRSSRRAEDDRKVFSAPVHALEMEPNIAQGFRDALPESAAARGVSASVHARLSGIVHDHDLRLDAQESRGLSRWRLARIRPGRREALDRKSTRLNSSHGYISYAVFCFKKKKKKK